jgi:hypothetical protein
MLSIIRLLLIILYALYVEMIEDSFDQEYAQGGFCLVLLPLCSIGIGWLLCILV